ncbi:hypothetical protein FQA39_LY18915 [Lamprigera yunnana]|nr:hypothetical protein FQA39_LY18915 [Lamprigera yunnana]
MRSHSVSWLPPEIEIGAQTHYHHERYNSALAATGDEEEILRLATATLNRRVCIDAAKQGEWEPLSETGSDIAKRLSTEASMYCLDRTGRVQDAADGFNIEKIEITGTGIEN